MSLANRSCRDQQTTTDDRELQRLIERRLGELPAVMPLESPQVGKTTLANAIGVQHPGARALDLERASPSQTELFFAALRPEIDADRRAGRLLVLSSASGALLRQSSESLAGRVAYLELA